MGPTKKKTIKIMAVSWMLCLMLLHICSVYPLRQLYLEGPALQDWGFWEGKDFVDICAQLTGVSAKMWETNFGACSNLIERKFRAFVLGVYTVFYVIVLYKLAEVMYWRHIIWKPALQEFKEQIKDTTTTTIQ
jgi:hypothetical protein